jgi:hypothetical protein
MSSSTRVVVKSKEKAKNSYILRIGGLSHTGASLFFEHVDPCFCLKEATETVLTCFETAPTKYVGLNGNRRDDLLMNFRSAFH